MAERTPEMERAAAFADVRQHCERHAGLLEEIETWLSLSGVTDPDLPMAARRAYEEMIVNVDRLAGQPSPNSSNGHQAEDRLVETVVECDRRRRIAETKGEDDVAAAYRWVTSRLFGTVDGG